MVQIIKKYCAKLPSGYVDSVSRICMNFMCILYSQPQDVSFVHANASRSEHVQSQKLLWNQAFSIRDCRSEVCLVQIRKQDHGGTEVTCAE